MAIRRAKAVFLDNQGNVRSGMSPIKGGGWANTSHGGINSDSAEGRNLGMAWHTQQWGDQERSDGSLNAKAAARKSGKNAHAKQAYDIKRAFGVVAG